MSQYFFGSGGFYFVPSGSNPTPVNVACLQDISLKPSGEMKYLYGQKAYPVAVASGKQKLEGKAKFGAIDLYAWNAFKFGGTYTAGATALKKLVIDEARTITTHACTAVNGATFVTDLGCIATAPAAMSDKRLVAAASAIAEGQYVTPTAGVGTYNLYTSTAITAVKISYLYTAAGENVVITNPMMGGVTSLCGYLGGYFDSKYFTIKLNSVVCPSMDLPFKNDDFGIYDLEFTCCADASDEVWTLFGEDSLATT